jgi:hypothetical protein
MLTSNPSHLSLQELVMKTSIILRTAALAAAIVTTFVLVEWVALFALPPDGGDLLLAQAAIEVARQ